MPDALTISEKVALRGLEKQIALNGRTATVNGTLYTGVRTELAVDDGDNRQGGFRKKKAFRFTIVKSQVVAEIKGGQTVVDDTSGNYVVQEVLTNNFRVRITCISASGSL
jgi:hypothetical protein